MNKQNNKKIPIFLKLLIAIFLIILVVFLVLYGLYKSRIDVSDKHGDEFDQINEITDEYTIKDFVKYDESEPDYLYIDIPKDFIYSNYLNIEELNTTLNNNYNITINRIGFIGDENDINLIKFSLDCTYSKTINLNFYAVLYLKYEYEDPNLIKFYFNDLIIGDNVPKDIYSKYIPFEQDEFIYEVTITNELLENNNISLKNILNTDINKENICIQYDLLSTVKELASDLLNIDFSNSDKYDKVFKALINTFIDLITSSN